MQIAENGIYTFSFPQRYPLELVAQKNKHTKRKNCPRELMELAAKKWAWSPQSQSMSCNERTFNSDWAKHISREIKNVYEFSLIPNSESWIVISFSHLCLKDVEFEVKSREASITPKHQECGRQKANKDPNQNITWLWLVEKATFLYSEKEMHPIRPSSVTSINVKDIR